MSQRNESPNDSHLPECRARYVADLCTTDIDPVIQERSCDHCVGLGCICICHQLRACEQRTLDAAREAVEAIRDALQTHYRIDCEPVGEVDWSQHQQCDPVDDILAAIDAIRDKP